MSTSDTVDEHTMAAAEVDDLVIDRSCISCDNCGVGSPQKCCGRCGSYYYCRYVLSICVICWYAAYMYVCIICLIDHLHLLILFAILQYLCDIHSKECQVQDWKQHKAGCTVIKKQHDMWKEDRSKVLPESSALNTKEGPCAICLEETIENPVVLPCGHDSCFECIGEYQCSPNSKASSCPYCRGEIPNVVKKSLDRSMLYTKRAMQSPKGSEEQKKYARLSMAEYDNAEKVFNVKGKGNNLADNGEMDVGGMFMRSVVVALSGQPEETIKITNKTLSLNERYPGYMDLYQVHEVKNSQAKAYSELGKWEEAEKIYTSIYKECMRRNKVHNGSLLVGMCRALYMRKKYDKAIKIGTMVTKDYRSTPGIHKYLALSQKALGNIDEARITITKAILYEQQWVKDNLEENKQILRELNNH